MKKADYTSLMHSFLPGKESYSYEQKVLENYSKIVFTRQENDLMHNSYAQERREMQSIETGNLEMLEKCWTEFQKSSYGKLSPNRLRNIKNHCIVIISFASRAAIRGGVIPEIAYTLCDSYIQGVEECDTPTILIQLARRAEQYFTKLVMQAKGISDSLHTEGYSQHIEHCKNYIFSHLHQKMTVQEIADALHLNPNYLNGLFKKYEKQSILQFILQEKIKLAQNMLIYSTYSYSEIANYLGFSSQSHLGIHFKKNLNMTMSQYRAEYQAK